MGVLIRLIGVETVQQRLGDIADGAGQAGKSDYFVGSPLPYSFGIETGRTRGGRLARRAGGAYMLTRALQTVAPGIPAAIGAALPKGGGAVDAAIRRLAFEVLSRAQGQTPVRTGALRASMQVSGRVR